MDVPNRRAQAHAIQALREFDPDAWWRTLRPRARDRARVEFQGVGNYNLDDIKKRVGYGSWVTYTKATFADKEGLWLHVPLQRTPKFERVRAALAALAYTSVSLGVATISLTLAVHRLH